ncbi:MAG TPA: FAD-binding oxidoreductase [Acidimicrobiales bacterium]|nr:FAD-binding oxidoreductase [Acidimicrobiales bacterium]
MTTANSAGPDVAGLVARLRDLSDGVSEAPPDTADAGVDWWPLAMVFRHKDSHLLPSRPDVVVRPSSAEKVAAVLKVCATEGVPVTAFGGRSGVCGGSLPVHGGVSLDLGGLSGIEDVDGESMLVTVGAGTNGRAFEDELRGTHGLTVGHWPQSIDLASVGGWVACRGAGQYSTRYGVVADMVEGLEVALADGSLIRTGWRGPRSATGPDLTQLFVGSEGTLGVVTKVRLRAHPAPVDQWKAAWVFPDFATGLGVCRRVLRRGATPAVLRLYDKRETRRHFADDAGSGCALVALDEGDSKLIEATRHIVSAEAAADGEARPASLVDHWLETRNHVGGLGDAVAAGLVVDTCEIAAPWAAARSLAESAPAAVMAVPDTLAATVHASHHYSDGTCLYVTFAGKTDDPARWYVSVWDALMRNTLDAGGAISHHHGIGLVRGRHMREALGPAFDVLKGLKASLDPTGVLNPGKLGLPSPFGEPVWP